ncbi:hypothetical protein N9N67_02185 [Bacteriovoracaceae bacterium]|nr:hypothetical protein [Bacteriovoracaceae bacterium]
MKLSLSLILASLFIFSCGKPNSKPEVQQEAISADDYQFSINQKPSKRKTIRTDKYWYTDEYYRGDISLYLYDDGKVYYELENLGSGEGEWKYADDKITLKASFSFIDMEFELFLTERNPDKFYLKFTDSKGTQVKEVKLKQ